MTKAKKSPEKRLAREIQETTGMQCLELAKKLAGQARTEAGSVVSP